MAVNPYWNLGLQVNLNNLKGFKKQDLKLPHLEIYITWILNWHCINKNDGTPSIPTRLQAKGVDAQLTNFEVPSSVLELLK